MDYSTFKGIAEVIVAFLLLRVFVVVVWLVAFTGVGNGASAVTMVGSLSEIF